MAGSTFKVRSTLVSTGRILKAGPIAVRTGCSQVLAYPRNGAIWYEGIFRTVPGLSHWVDDFCMSLRNSGTARMGQTSHQAAGRVPPSYSTKSKVGGSESACRKAQRPGLQLMLVLLPRLAPIGQNTFISDHWHTPPTSKIQDKS